MPVFVHLTSDRNLKQILHSGIKTSRIEPSGLSGVYCMPLIKDYYISHQWLRELKRKGTRTIISLYLRLSSEEDVFLGHYKDKPVKMKANRAVKTIMDSEDPLGYQVVIPRKIHRKEIFKWKYVSQLTGWRYSPDSHHSKISCLCPACIPKGAINSQKIRKNRYKKLLKELKAAKEDDVILRLLADMSDIIIWCRGRIKEADDLKFLIDHPSDQVVSGLVSALSSYNNDRSVLILSELMEHKNKDIRDQSARGIMQIKGEKGFSILDRYKTDRSIQKIVDEYREIYLI
ncbi:MAG: hypothetical protein JW827_06405 [Spirochaetes bacterium]|nr:hypothetical protein [Spirochaetota bacterium]